MQCPTCVDERLVMSERQGVEIDYCPRCRGVWLDRGELDKIIERAQVQDAPKPSQPQMQPQPSGDYHGAGHQHGKYEQKHYKRKKSIWEELFD
ncbi:zf-TFIIB domain-containing protein [Jeongeupia wiesaeckerbachi]|uniref:TFIIB-type zinc ribbon-containing protein n=1 Tax=Jeongeupia wiesaeckerbachi TaxID=3051218 RepID=UPI003D807387